MPDEKVRNILVVSVWATVCKTAALCYRTVVLSVLSCLSCLSVTFVHCIFMLFFFFFSSPNLSRRRLVWNLLHAAPWETQDVKKVAKNRLSTIAQLCRAICLQLRHVSTIGKKLVKHQYLLHMSSQYGELRPTNGWDRLTILGHPCKFQLVSRLGTVSAVHGTVAVGVSQSLRRWTEGATFIRQGTHHAGHWPTF